MSGVYHMATAMRSEFLRHGRALLGVGALSAVGILATVAYQLLTGRALGPGAYGLLAAFMSIVTIASTGSSALQSAVAVSTAKALQNSPETSPKWRNLLFDSSMIEAIVLGGIGTTVVLLFARPISQLLGTSLMPVAIAAAGIIPAFLLARALGILQGIGLSQTVTAWTSGSVLLRLLLTAILLSLSFGVVSVLFTVVVSTASVAIGATVHAVRKRVAPDNVPFSRHTVVVLLIVIAFAWLSNIEIVFVRNATPEVISGNFAAAATLTKTLFLVPSTLSIYLLPRFVSTQNNKSKTLRGIYGSLAAVLIVGVGGFFLSLILAQPIVHLLYGSQYEYAANYLPLMALAYLPWGLSQTLLIRLSAVGSFRALLLLIAAAVIEWIGLTMALPSLSNALAVLGFLGLGLAIGLVLITRSSLASIEQLTE